MPFYHLSFLRIIYRSCCQYLNWSSQVIRRFFCLFSLIVVGGFYFYIDLLDNYLAIDDESGDRFGLHDEIFNWFFIATVGVVIVAIFRLLGRQKRRAICPILFVVGAISSLWFRQDLGYFGDRVFLSFNEPRFRSKIEVAGVNRTTLALQWVSRADTYKIFVYSPARSLNDGPVSQKEVDAFEDLDELKGCRFYARHLKSDFYTIIAGCR